MNAPQPVLLLTPGPTPLHPRAAAALSWPMIGHMDPEVFAFNDRVVRDLKTLYGADDDAFTALLSGTGSLGMEAGFANLLEPGDKALILSNGVFGERMAEMAARLGADVTVLRAPLGLPFDVAEVRRAAHEFEALNSSRSFTARRVRGCSTRYRRSAGSPARSARSTP